MRGFVYVMANEHMPLVVKIGYTDRDPETRARELSSTTGVPGKYEVMYFAYVDGPQEIEKFVHNNLAKFRSDKEFFCVSLPGAIGAIRAVKPTIIFEGLSSVVQDSYPELAVETVSELSAQIRFLSAQVESLSIEIEGRNEEIENYKTKLESYKVRLGIDPNKKRSNIQARKRKKGY